MACAPLDIICQGQEGLGNIVSAAANNTLQELTNQALQGFGQAVASLGTMWVYLPSPVLTNGTGQAGGGTPPGSAGVTTILGYVMWIALVICVLSIIAIGAMLAVRIRRGDGEQLLGRLGIVLAAVILISGGTGLVAGLLPNQAPGGSASAVGFLQNSLWWYVGAMAVVSVIIAGIRMAWEQRANPGKELLQSLLTLIVVSGAGLTIIGLAVAATDAFSVWVLNGAMGPFISETFQLSAAQKGFMLSVPILAGALMRFPLGVLFMAVVSARGAIDRLTGRGPVWRGRRYPQAAAPRR